MSLDVYLTIPQSENKVCVSGIYIREDGQNKQISREEWDRRFPGQNPVAFTCESEEYRVFDYNITHNLNTMADAAGIYEQLWRPEELGIEKAKDLIQSLENGLAKLETDPNRYKQYNPENGWGDYEGLVRFVKEYLAACKKYPEATISISR